MNQARLFAPSVPVLVRYLGTLKRILHAVEAMPPERAATTLQSRLAPDMLPFLSQVETSAYFTLRTAYPLAGRALPPFEHSAPTCAGLHAKVAETLALLAELKPSEFIDAEARIIREKAGFACLELSAERFLFEYALPNFLFHLSMAYAIARSQGAVLGKAEYDGFHAYKSASAA
jgi:uncharacterized protein